MIDWRPWHCLPRPFWDASSSNARLRCTAPPPRTPTLLAPPPSCPSPPLPPPPHTSMHTSPPAPITNQQPLLVAFFGSSRTLAFIRVPQARLALKLCWPDSFRYATGGARTFARHSAKRMPATAPIAAPATAPNPCPPQRRAYARHSARHCTHCLEHAPCWAHWALGAREMTWAIHAPLRSWARSSVGGTLESFVGPSCR